MPRLYRAKSPCQFLNKMKLEQRAKIYGIIGTLLFHAALLLFLWFWVLSREIPEEQGLSVMLGVETEGGFDFFEPTPAHQVEGFLAPSYTDPLSPNPEEFLTQDIEESIAMPDTKTEEELRREQELREQQRRQELERQEEQRRIAEARAQQEARDRRAAEIGNQARNVFGGTGAGGAGNADASTGQGTGQSTGNQGNPFGTPGATGTQGGGVGSGGNSYSLAGRSLVGDLVRPTYNVSEEGRVVVTIIVNSEGAVISATVGAGTNISNPELRRAAVEAAQKTRFNKINTGNNQSGTITYMFRLQ